MLTRARVNRRKIARRPWRWPRLAVDWRAVLMPPLAVAAAVAVWPLASDLLDLPARTLVVEGTFERVSAVEVHAAAAAALGGGFLGLDLDELRASIEGLDWVDMAEVRRDWPDTIRVRITEHQAAARWGDTGLLNVRGELFTTSARHPYAELPRLAGPAGSETAVARLYLAVRGRLADAQLTLDTLAMDARGAVEIALSGGQRIRVGRHDVDARLDRFFKVVAPALAADLDRVDYVDLRYTNGFAVAWRPASVAEAAPAREAPDHG